MAFDDYQLDILFGEWLKSQRIRSGLSLEDVTSRTQVPTGRLRSLEVGVADRGITLNELKSLSAVYNCDFNEMHRRAIES